MRICHVSPHLPPDQAANALLPAQLGAWQRARGDDVRFVAHAAAQAGARSDAGGGDRVTFVARRTRRGLAGRLRLDTLAVVGAVTRALDAEPADLVHLHSNGLIIEAAARAARRRAVPYVLTLYGTEIWHYAPRRLFDPFTRAYRGAAAVTFYSRRLEARARELGLSREHLETVYPPVDARFAPMSAAHRAEARRAFGIRESAVLLNVKRLHPLAGQDVLIDAFARLARDRKDVRLIICGTGPLRDALEAQAVAAGVADRVTFAGLVPNDQVARYDALADVFVLPSRLEALPTVAVEALACGTPVVSADHPGGLELAELFGDAVTLVPREDPAALARAMSSALDAGRRVPDVALAAIDRLFRPSSILARYDDVYATARGGRR